MKSSRPRSSLRIAATLAATGLAASLLVVSQAFADFSLTDWRYVKPVILPPGLQDEGLVEVFPDPESFAGSSPGLVDIRVIADDGTEVPYSSDIGRGERQRTPFPVSIRDQGYVQGRYTSFVADLGREGLLHNEIEVLTPSSNFRRTAVVESSNDGVTWARMAEQQVFDFTVRERSFTTRDTRVRYTDSTRRYLRVEVADDGEGPLEITGATVFFVKESPAREVLWPAAVLGIRQDSERHLTLVEVDVGVQGIPSRRMVLKVPDVNFYREVMLEASSDRVEWRTLVPKDAIYAYDTPKFVGSGLALAYPEATSRYFRIVILNEDNPPLDVQGAEVWGLQHRLVFSADPRRSYSLYYGNPKAGKPSYDIERVFPYLVTQELPQASLGPQAENPQFVEEIPPPPPLSERLHWLLPSVVAGAAVIVALLLFGVLRQARKVLPPPVE